VYYARVEPSILATFLSSRRRLTECSEAEKNNFSKCGALNLWDLVRPNSLNTPESGPEYLGSRIRSCKPVEASVMCCGFPVIKPLTTAFL